MLRSLEPRNALVALLVLLGTVAVTARAGSADERLYQWSFAGVRGDSVTLHFAYERHEAGSTRIESSSRPVPLSTLRGLSASDIAASPGGTKRFEVVEEAGSLVCDGSVGNGHGSGTFRFVPDPAFERELTRRGIGPARDDELLVLALGRFKLATLDAVLAAGFERPTLADLAEMTDHGVSADYARGFKDVPLAPKSVRALGALRDHGVQPAFVAALADSHFRAFSEAEIATLADHGARADLVRALAASSYRGISAAQIAALADHGVSAGYITGLDRIGFHPDVVEIARLHDNGVTTAFIQRLRDHGYRSMSVDDIIKLFQHGV